MKSTVKFSFPSAPASKHKTIADALGQLVPNKVQNKETGEIAVVVCVPTDDDGRTFLFFDKTPDAGGYGGGLTWAGGERGKWIDENYILIGPLLSTESVTFSGQVK